MIAAWTDLQTWIVTIAVATIALVTVIKALK